MIIPNAWFVPVGNIGEALYANKLISRSMLHDENHYPDPFTFNPDRFMKDGKLNKGVKDPAAAAFGFGRRSVASTMCTAFRPTLNTCH